MPIMCEFPNKKTVDLLEIESYEPATVNSKEPNGACKVVMKSGREHVLNVPLEKFQQVYGEVFQAASRQAQLAQRPPNGLLVPR